MTERGGAKKRFQYCLNPYSSSQLPEGFAELEVA